MRRFAFLLALLLAACGGKESPDETGGGRGASAPDVAERPRPLTEKDLEDWLWMNEKVQGGATDSAAIDRLLRERGLSTLEFSMLTGRITGAMAIITAGAEPDDQGTTREDVAFLKKH